MKIQCPCCGGEMKWAMPREELPRQFLSLGKRRTGQVTLMAKLVLYLSNPVRAVKSLRQISDYLWGYDPNGGPVDARGVIVGTISRAKVKLARYGWEIKNHHGLGWSLEPVDGLKERAVSASTMVMTDD